MNDDLEQTIENLCREMSRPGSPVSADVQRSAQTITGNAFADGLTALIDGHLRLGREPERMAEQLLSDAVALLVLSAGRDDAIAALRVAVTYLETKQRLAN